MTWTVVVAGLVVLIAVLAIISVPDSQARDIASYQKAKERAERGEPMSELRMGQLLRDGIGTLKNAQEAVAWFKKAADHGNIEAQYLYGNALLEGVGILQNYKEAMIWIEKSARAGYTTAQYKLGNIYRYKSGIENDPKQAYLWLTLAAGQGSVEAAVGRDQIEGRLKPEEIAALQEEANRISRGMHH